MLASVSKLGSVLERSSKYEEAETIHRRALQGSTVSPKLLGQDVSTLLGRVGQAAKK